MPSTRRRRRLVIGSVVPRGARYASAPSAMHFLVPFFVVLLSVDSRSSSSAGLPRLLYVSASSCLVGRAEPQRAITSLQLPPRLFMLDGNSMLSFQTNRAQRLYAMRPGNWLRVALRAASKVDFSTQLPFPGTPNKNLCLSSNRIVTRERHCFPANRQVREDFRSVVIRNSLSIFKRIPIPYSSPLCEACK